MATKVSISGALPHACELPLETTALVIIDMQIDFLDPKGFGACLGNDVSVCHSIIPPCERLLSEWRKHGRHVLYTLEAHLPDLSDCPPAKLNGPRTPPPGKRIGDVLSPEMGRILIQGEPGNGIIPELKPAPGEKVVHKPGKDMFYHTDVADYLKVNGITHLIFTGVTTEVCVQTSMRAANDRGYECVLLEDCTASYFPAFKQSTIEAVRAQGGIIGWTASSTDLIAGLSGHKSSRL